MPSAATKEIPGHNSAVIDRCVRSFELIPDRKVTKGLLKAVCCMRKAAKKLMLNSRLGSQSS